MTLRVVLRDGSEEDWPSVSDERSWFDHGHTVTDGELVVYVHEFRRVRERFDRTQDLLWWKHHTTKVAKRYPDGSWNRVVDVRRRTPPIAPTFVPRRQRVRET